MSYLMQAKASDTGELHFWSSETADFAGEGYAGTGDPEDIAIFLLPSLSSSGPASAPVVTQAQVSLPALGLAIDSFPVLAIEMPVTVLEGRKLSLSWSLRLHAAAGSPARYVVYFYVGTESGFDVEDDLLVPTNWVEGEFPGDSSDLYHGVSGTSPVLGLAPGEWIIKCAVAEAGSGTERMDVSVGINPSLQLVQYV